MNLLLLLIFTVFVFFINNSLWLLITLLTLLSLISLSPKRQQLFIRLKPLLVVCLLVIIIQFNQLREGISAALRILILSLAVFYYTGITSPRKIVNDLRFLPDSFKLMLTISFSLISVIFTEAKKISLVQKRRGLKTAAPFPLVIPLLHRVLKRSEQLTLVLQCRR